ncbi:hypothetical protein GE21DRAFT_1305935 [Neurospora crassa]|nr:hypothetical protein GE21DRAFT_1305935 [Neurospora crassa]
MAFNGGYLRAGPKSAAMRRFKLGIGSRILRLVSGGLGTLEACLACPLVAAFSGPRSGSSHREPVAAFTGQIWA